MEKKLNELSDEMLEQVSGGTAYDENLTDNNEPENNEIKVKLDSWK